MAPESAPKDSTPRLQRRPPINRSSAPFSGKRPSLHDDIRRGNAEISKPTRLGSAYTRRYVVPPTPYQGTVPLPPVDPESPSSSRTPESETNTSVFSTESNAPNSSYSSETTSLPNPWTSSTSREDPLIDRAINAARACSQKAESMRELLGPCETLLRVAESGESCLQLMSVFSALESLGGLPPGAQHPCQPLGLCPHEIWHETHARKVEELAELLDHFLADFDPERPRKTATLNKKLARYVERFQELHAGIQRSWTMLESDVNAGRIQNYLQGISVTERQLAELRQSYETCRERQAWLMWELATTPA
ncbi:hypothetical protein C8R47DRAFT_511225 [Mycena vitilis]|nr:hypothetical protein C8R47DRAFT_511225 [Mycena vitilis]